MFNGVNMQSMKKRCLLTTAIALILCGITNNAGAKGPIRFGIKAGIQSQSLHASKDEVLGVFSADKDFGYQFGFVARINFPMLYIQPELNYAKHRFTMDMEDGATTKVKVINIELPILVGWKIAFVRLFAGPVFTLMNDTGNKLKNTSAAINTELAKSLVGYQLGGGVEFGRVNVDMRYGGQFKKPELTVVKGEQQARTYKTSMNQWQLNISYLF